MLHLTTQILTTVALFQPPAGSNPQPLPPIPSVPSAVSANQGATGRETRQRNVLGVKAAAISPLLASQMTGVVGEAVGVVVLSVAPRSPAEAAGIRQHDILVSFGDSEIRKPAQLGQLVAKADPGATVKIALLRAMKRQTVSVTLSTSTINSGPAASGPRPSGRPRHYCKVEVVMQSDQRFRVTTERCVDGAPPVKREFSGSVDEVAVHFEKSPAIVRNNISICFQSLQPNRSRKLRPSVRILPRVEKNVRYVRFVNVRTTPEGPGVYVYDKRMPSSAAAGSLANVTEEKDVRDQLGKLPKPIQERIDQTVRQFKDAASVNGNDAP